jgi:hypothetical protein
MACAFIALWVRSLSVGNMLGCGTGRHWVNYIGSTSGLMFVGECGERGSPSRRTPKWFQFPASMELLERPMLEKSWHWLGFGIYETTFDPEINPDAGIENVHINTIERYLTIPYWSIVLPLTALSAWRLLSKQRPPNQSKPIVEARRWANSSMVADENRVF